MCIRDSTGPSAGIKLQSDDNRLLDAAGNIIIKTDANSANLYFNGGSPKLSTTNTGITVTGTVAATSFTGNGSNLTGIEAFVTGMIILWSGAANAIPSGFVLCNGSNGTPDLRGRFVVGYHDGNGDYDVNDTGGAASVTLSTSQIPSHSHTTNNHTHSFLSLIHI